MEKVVEVPKKIPEFTDNEIQDMFETEFKKSNAIGGIAGAYKAGFKKAISLVSE